MSDKKEEVAIIDFTKFDIAQLPELKGKKKEITAVIKANPIVEVTDNASYELAKKSRTAVKTLRTSLEKEKKDVNDRIKKNVLEVVAIEYDALISEVKTNEAIRQEKVDAWEEKKEQERLEKARLEELRIKNIKDAIQTFKDAWEDTINHLLYEGIGGAQQHFGKTVAEFDRVKLAEYEVLFDDAVSYLGNLLNSRIKTLEEQENIRLEQIRLAEEKEKQEAEAKRIAEQQRIEREKFEAEQKAAAEKIRIAQEKFLAEKKEFEEKQAEAKYQERKKFLVDEDYWRIYLLTECDEKEEIAKGKLLNYTDEQFNGKFKEAIVKAKTPIAEIEVIVEEMKSDESANNKGLSTRLKAGNSASEIIEQIDIQTWDSIQDNFTAHTGIFFSDDMYRLLEYLKENYSVPTPKN